MLPLVSVIIPTYNDAKWLQISVPSLLKQDYPNLEIVVVDDLSNDNTPDIISNFPNVKYIRLTKKGYEAGARNAGVINSNGKIIVQVDSDAEYPPDFVSKIVGPIVSGLADATIRGYILPYFSGSLMGRFWKYKRLASYSLKLKGLKKPYGVSAYLRTVFEKIGGYNSNVFVGTDVDFSCRVTKLTSRIVWVKDAYFYHNDPPTLFGTFKRLFWHYYNVGGLYRKQGISYQSLAKKIGALILILLMVVTLYFNALVSLSLLFLPILYFLMSQESREGLILAINSKDPIGVLGYLLGLYLTFLLSPVSLISYLFKLPYWSKR